MGFYSRLEHGLYAKPNSLNYTFNRCNKVDESWSGNPAGLHGTIKYILSAYATGFIQKLIIKYVSKLDLVFDTLGTG